MTNSNDVAFPFIIEDDEGKLVPLILSYLAIGQFELARASLLLLSEIDPASAFRVLQTVIEHGPSDGWRSSASVPSAAHLIWLCILEHDSLRAKLAEKLPADQIPPPILDSTRKLASFEILLYDSFEVALSSAAAEAKAMSGVPVAAHSAAMTPLEWLNELRWCFRKMNGISRVDDALFAKAGAGITSRGAFSTALLENFKQLIQRNAFAAHRITLDLTVGSQSATVVVGLATMDLHKLWIQHISQLMDDEDYENVLATIPYLCFTDATMRDKVFSQSVMQLFQRLAEASDLLPSTTDKQKVTKKALYQAFMQCQSPEPLRSMCAAEEEQVRSRYKEDCEAKGVPVTHSLLSFREGTDVITSDPKAQQAFWRYIALYSYCTNTHFAEAMLLRALSLLDEGKLSQAAMTVAPLGEKLKPLLVLLGWDSHDDNSKFHFQLLKQLWTVDFAPLDVTSDDFESSEEPADELTLEEACNNLAYRIAMARWAAEILLQPEEGTQDVGPNDEVLWKKVGEIMRQTADSSLPKIIAKCLTKVPLNELLDMIKRNPNPNAGAAKSRDVNLIHGYDALRKVLRMIKKKETESKEEVDSIVNSMMSIKNPHQRLIVMRMMYSALFLRSEDTEIAYLASAESCVSVLNVLDKCCERTAVKEESEEGAKVNVATQEQFKMNFALLKQDVKESLHRVDFAQRLLAHGTKTVDGTSLPTEFVRLFLSSPSTFLSLALQFKDYKLCDEISAFFGEVAPSSLPNDLVDISEVSKTLDIIVKKITATDSLDKDDAISVCKTAMSSLRSVKQSPKVLTASMADAAFRCMHSASLPSLTAENRKKLLTRAKELFTAAAEETGDADDGAEVRRVLELLASLIEMTSDDNDLLFSDTAVVSVEALEKDAEAQKNVIRARQVKEDSNISFMKLTMHTIGGSVEEEEGFCLVDSMGEVDQEREIRAYLQKRGSTFSTMDAVDFVELFIRHILTLSDVLRDNVAKEKQEKLQQRLFFGLLESSPAQIVKDLIFKSNDYNSAKAVAELLHLDVDGIAVNGVATSNTDPANTAAQLTLPFAQFIARSWPNLAMLMCLTRFPIDAFHGELFQFALTLPVPPEVKRWMETRVFMLDLFAKIAMRKTFPDCKTAIPLDKEKGEILGLLRSCTVEDDEKFMNAILSSTLVNLSGREQILATANRVIVVADSRLDNGVSDSLLLAICDVLIKSTPPCIDVLPAVLERFTDMSKAIPLMREHYHSWTLETCLRLFSLNEETRDDYGKMLLFQDVFKLQRALLNIEDEYVPPWLSKWKTWQEVESACTSDAAGTIRLFLPLNEFGIARKIHKYFDGTVETKNEIEENCLIHMLVRSQASFSKQRQELKVNGGSLEGRISSGIVSNNSVADGMVDTSDVGLVLAAMGKEAINTVVGLLARLEKMHLKRPVWARASLFFLSFVLTNMNESIPDDLKATFIEHQHGLQAYVLLPEELQNVYFTLVHSPKLLIENMLMDRRVSDLSRVFQALPELREDKLVLRYARKAMDFRKGSVPPVASKDNIVSSQTEPPPVARLNGSKDGDYNARSMFSYPRTPNVGLTKALLDIVEDKLTVGNTCLEICNKLADGLTATEPRANEIVDVIISMLEYAKAVFQRGQLSYARAGSSSVEGVIVCDHFLSVATLFGKLLRNNCASTLASCHTGCIEFSLHDLLSMEKARWLRDKLIENDMLSIAVDVASECGITAGRIWSRWGFSMLHMGKYTWAREKFQYCFSNNASKSFQPRGAFNDDPDPKELLQQIIETLETEQDVDEAAIRCEFQSVLSSVSLPSAQSTALPPAPFQSSDIQLNQSVTSLGGAAGASMKTVNSDGSVAYETFQPLRLPDVIFNECMFYLKSYGTMKDTINFLLRHGKLEDACKLFLENKATPQQFVEDIVFYCLQRALLKDLQQAMKRIDDSLEKWKDCLMFICGFFNKHKAYDVLIDFQSFMHDYPRAGKTALLMLMEAQPTDFTRRLELLNTAKRMFANALEHPSPSPQPGFTISDISLFLRGTDLQILLTQLFQKNVKQVNQELLSLSLFGTNADRIKLAEESLILGGYDITFGIIQDFRLSGVKVYTAAMESLTRTAGKTRNAMSRIQDLIKQAKSNLLASELDTIIFASMEVFVNELHDTKSAEKLLSKLSSNKIRVRGQALCGQFKAAYLGATKDNLLEEVKYILSLAENKDATCAERCHQYIREHSETPLSPPLTNHPTPASPQQLPRSVTMAATPGATRPQHQASASFSKSGTSLYPTQPKSLSPTPASPVIRQVYSKPPPQPIQPPRPPMTSTLAPPREASIPGAQRKPAPSYGAPDSRVAYAALAPQNPVRQTSAPSSQFSDPSRGAMSRTAAAPSARQQRAPIPSNPFADDADQLPQPQSSTNPFLSSTQQKSTNPFLSSSTSTSSSSSSQPTNPFLRSESGTNPFASSTETNPFLRSESSSASTNPFASSNPFVSSSNTASRAPSNPFLDDDSSQPRRNATFTGMPPSKPRSTNPFDE